MGLLNYFLVQKTVFDQKQYEGKRRDWMCFHCVESYGPMYRICVHSFLLFLCWCFLLLTFFLGGMINTSRCLQQRRRGGEKKMFPFSLSACRKTSARELENRPTFQSLCWWQMNDACTGEWNDTARHTLLFISFWAHFLNTLYTSSILSSKWYEFILNISLLFRTLLVRFLFNNAE